MQKFSSFNEFYPFYLSEHQNKMCRISHFIGTSGVLFLLSCAIISKQFSYLYYVPLVGYGFAWFGHFIFEKNRPATFDHPFYSLLADFIMYKDLILRRISFNPK